MTLQQIIQLMRDARHGYLATCVNGQPRVRPMAFRILDDGRLWSSTYRVAGKVAELEANAKVEVCFALPQRAQVRVVGTMDITGGVEKKAKLLELNPHVGRHFPTPEDEKYVHLEVVPTLIRYKENGFCEYETVLG